MLVRTKSFSYQVFSAIANQQTCILLFAFWRFSAFTVGKSEKLKSEKLAMYK